MSAKSLSVLSGVRLPRDRDRSRGAALVIVLAFVVLLTGLIVAFFSRAVVARQVSNGSVNQLKAGLFAQGAIATTIADLRQEVYAGSTAMPAPTSSPGAPTLYLPKPGDGKVPSTLTPARVGTTFDADKVQYANLVKRSAFDKAFYPAEKTAGAPYAATNYVNNASGVKRASKSSTLSVSQNYRAMTPSRWNAPLYLPKPETPLAGETVDSATPDGAAKSFNSATGSSYSWDYAPDWILVSRNGSNPILTSDTLPPAVRWGATSDTAVVGRYAYNIYDEGGLLDINAAGYPILGGSAFPTYKSGVAFADLTSFADSKGKPYLSQTQIDQIVAWRNLSTINGNLTDGYITGSLPSFKWTDKAALGYYGFAAFGNFTGYVTPNSPKLSGTGSATLGLSDRLFTNRQSLIQLMLQSVADAGNPDQTSNASPANRSSVQNALQYLTSYSRDLNQPSFIPEATRPKVTAAPSSGGNDSSAANPDDINPSFLNIRVKTAFKRSDGTTAVVGEPLVKKRFLLQRLAWLTYKGPSSGRVKDIPKTKPADNDPNYDLWTLTQSGITSDFLQLGDDDTIKKYFGLVWNGDGWKYNVHNTGAGNGVIKKLSDIATSGRDDDPDFVELLQAAINVGAIGKSGVPSAASILKTFPSVADFNNETSVNASIIQILANMIDQFDGDGFPTKITWVFSGGSRDLYGSENLPYVYRVRPGVLKLRESDPPIDPKVMNSDSTIKNTGAAALKDMGVAMLMALPELWNPYDVDCSLGAPRPTDYGVYVDSGGVSPPEFFAGTHQDSPRLYAYDQIPDNTNPSAPRTSKVPFFSPNYPGNNATDKWPLKYVRAPYTQTNTLLTFNVPDTIKTMFREPTLLAQANKPNGSNLAMPSSTVSSLDNGYYLRISPGVTGGTSVFTDKVGFRSATPNPLRFAPGESGYSTTLPPTDSYVGIISGVLPLRWVEPASSGDGQIYNVYCGFQSSSAAICPTRFCVAYKNSSGAYVEYDRKDMPIGNAWTYVPYGNLMPDYKNQNAQAALLQPESQVAYIVDPRTSRFGPMMTDHTTNVAKYNDVPAQAMNGGGAPVKGGWINSADLVLTTNSPDAHAGYGVGGRTGNKGGNNWPSIPGMSSRGWYVTGATDNLYAVSWPRPSLFSRNNPLVANDGAQYDGNDPGAVAGPSPQFYADPDGVVRRAMGGYVPSIGVVVGLPEARAQKFDPSNKPTGTAGSDERATQSQSRPWILNRPFRSVGELSYVFSGIPWRNLDMATPESGFSALLDICTVSDTQDPQGLVAGKVNINTLQKPVLRAILGGAYRDEKDPTGSQLTVLQRDTIVDAFYKRTTSLDPLLGPIANISQLVGRWNPNATEPPIAGTTAPFNINGAKHYIGFSDDLTNILTTDTDKNISRFREAAIRPLAAAASSGRVWNLMIDLVAQTGRYPGNAEKGRQFMVEGERRYWVHVTIDRLTGDVIDQQIEVINE